MAEEHDEQTEVLTVDPLDIDGKYTIRFVVGESTIIKDYIESEVKPACQEWYPKIISMLPSKSYKPTEELTIIFKEMDGVAYTMGDKIVCSTGWFLRNLEGEATGAIVHELVHTVQKYPYDRRQHRVPRWLSEGVADHIRWFLYEPESHRPRPNFARANYDDSYRTTAAFLDYLVKTHDEDFVVKVNAALREGEYTVDYWKEATGKSPEELWQEYVNSSQAA